MITVARTAIDENEDAGALTQRLAELGAQALSETVDAIAAGTATRTPQEHSQSTYAPMLNRELSNVDWTKSAHSIHCQIRGLLPWPAASTTLFFRCAGETVLRRGNQAEQFLCAWHHCRSGQKKGSASSVVTDRSCVLRNCRLQEANV